VGQPILAVPRLIFANIGLRVTAAGEASPLCQALKKEWLSYNVQPSGWLLESAVPVAVLRIVPL
jgi:hypothetical protein